MKPEEKNRLMRTACRVRMGILEATHAARSGHPGGSPVSYTHLDVYKRQGSMRRASSTVWVKMPLLRKRL